MINKIKLLRNDGFKWDIKRNVSCKGYCYLNNTYYERSRFTDVWRKVKTEEDFTSILKEINGFFATIIDTNDYLFCAVDRLRSIPLFYALKNNTLYLSDDIYWIKEETGYNEINNLNKEEFHLTGYVTGDETLINNIYQLQAGEYLIWDKDNKKLEKNFYFEYEYGDIFKDDEHELLDKLDEIHLQVFKRLIKSLNGRQAVIPLSGGYDSRTIAVMLKRLNYDNVLCFTYGKKGNKESEISKQVADSLGFKWEFVEYTPETWENWYNKKKSKQYIKYASNLSSLPIKQDYPAIEYLKKKKIINKNSIIIPGHTYDFLQGGHIPQELSPFKKYSSNDLYKEIVKKHYILWRNKINKTVTFFSKKLPKELQDNTKNKMYLPQLVELFEMWELRERQGKFIVNSLRGYDYFDYEWRLPLWDNQLIDFWRKTPINFRIDRRLFTDYIKTSFPKGADIVFNQKSVIKTKRKISNKITNILLETNIFNILNIKWIRKSAYLKDPLYFYHPYSYEHFLKYRKDARSINSLCVNKYLDNFI